MAGSLDLLDAIPYVGPAAKTALGIYQLFQNVKRTDSTTPEDREVMANARQAQAAQMPGVNLYEARLAQGQNAAVQQAALGSGSASDFLAASGAANRTREQGEQASFAQQDAYHQRANGQLNAVLTAAANRSRADTERANQANAQLTGAGLNNLSNGLNEAGSVATYQGLQNSPAPAATSNGTLPVAPPPVYSEDYQNPYYRARRSGMYGGYPIR